MLVKPITWTQTMIIFNMLEREGLIHISARFPSSTCIISELLQSTTKIQMRFLIKLPLPQHVTLKTTFWISIIRITAVVNSDCPFH